MDSPDFLKRFLSDMEGRLKDHIDKAVAAMEARIERKIGQMLINDAAATESAAAADPKPGTPPGTL